MAGAVRLGVFPAAAGAGAAVLEQPAVEQDAGSGCQGRS